MLCVCSDYLFGSHAYYYSPPVAHAGKKVVPSQFKGGKYMGKCKPVVRVFEQDPETTKWHYIDQTEHKTKKKNNPKFDKRLKLGKGMTTCMASFFFTEYLLTTCVALYLQCTCQDRANSCCLK